MTLLAKDRLFLVHPELARDRYRVDVLVERSRFVQELPPQVSEPVNVAESREPDGLDALPGGPRYQLPSFLEPGGDGNDEVN